MRALIAGLLLVGLVADVGAQNVGAVPDAGVRMITVDRAKVEEIRVFARSESIDIVVQQNKRRWFTPLANLLLVGDPARLDQLSQKLGAAVHHEEKVGDLVLKVRWLGWAANGGNRWLDLAYGKDTASPVTGAQVLDLVREINVSGLRSFIVRHGDLPWWHTAANNFSWSLTLPFESEPFFTGSES